MAPLGGPKAVHFTLIRWCVKDKLHMSTTASVKLAKMMSTPEHTYCFSSHLKTVNPIHILKAEGHDQQLNL